MWISDLGQEDSDGNFVSEQPHIGVLFKGHNNRTSAPAPTQDANFNWKSADILTHEAIRNMGYSLASLIVPDNPVFYNNPIFTKEQTDNSEDASFPYTHSINLGYLHSNTIDNFNIHDHLARYGGGWNVWWKLRGPGFKFGH